MALNLTYEVRRSPRWNTFLAGLALNIAGIMLLMAISSRMTTVVPRPSVAKNYTPLVFPIGRPVVQSHLQMAKLEPPKLTPALVLPEKTPPPREPMKIEPAKSEAPKIELPRSETPKVAVSIPAKLQPTAEVKTNVFSSEKSEVPNVKPSTRQVQTGGFGDPNGVAGQGDPTRNTATVASLGSFDFPAGPGKGNGTGGSHGVSGTVRSSGFGTEVAATGAHRRGSVVSGGFGDVVAQNTGSGPLQVQKKPDLEPVQIVFKPRPAYTPEARRLRVEGEVLLEVVFNANGLLQIKRVVKGLGYGLDDTALAAAQHIKFRPARKDGQPYDCAALVHMVFELAE